MATLTESAHTGEFILSEANGHRSRETGTLVSGQNLSAGTVLKDNGAGKLTAATGELESDGSLTNAAVGVLLDNVDASGGDADAVYIARDAEVNDNLITYPAESSAGGEKAATVASLKTLGIIARA